MKISDTPFFKPSPYFTNCSLFMEKIEPPTFFFKNFENSSVVISEKFGINITT